MNVLLIPYRYLGDTLLAVPLARALHARGDCVSWLVSDNCAPMLAHQPFASEVLRLSDLAGMRALRLWQRHDLALVVNGTDRLTAIARLAARRVHATLTRDRVSDAWKRRLVTGWIPFENEKHTIEYVRELGRKAGLEMRGNATLDWNDEDRARARHMLALQEGDAYVVIHPFSRVRYKEWPLENWRRLANLFAQQGYRVIVTGSADNAPAAASLGHHVHIACGKLDWRALTALLAGASLYVGVDTVATHLAAGCGAPTVALFGPTNPRLWGPWPAGWNGSNPWSRTTPDGLQHCGNVTIVQNRNACVPCQQEGCDAHIDSSSKCLNDLESDRVLAVCMEKISEPTND